ncbi:MAG: DUF4276 family protein [Bacteroidota bacterium]|nr:DUF4276 family protein [Bacteroidota bacterium]
MKIYIEGGGDSDKLHTECREAFTKFFTRAGLAKHRKMPKLVACGGRGMAYDRFCTAIKQGEDALLLVDSEAPIATDPATGKPVGPWAHLKLRDKWTPPPGATDAHVYLMAECMESWFVGDRDGFIAYYTQGNRRCNTSKIPVVTDIEPLAKTKVLADVKAASLPSGMVVDYSKGSRSFDILGTIDPEQVAKTSYHAQRLFCRLGVTWWAWLKCKHIK